jgi:hypothetical protein
MIDAKAAATNAEKFLHALFEGKPIGSVRVEEAELGDDAKHWMITLSFDAKVNSIGLDPRALKVFKVRTDDGLVVSMKMRLSQ